jgi:hypothetical protein
MLFEQESDIGFDNYDFYIKIALNLGNEYIQYK